MSVVEDSLAQSRVGTSERALEQASTDVYEPIKRLLDVGFVLLLTPICAPAVGLLALLVSLDGHNAFHTQRRVGKGGHHFTIFKLRSMVPDAEASLKNHLEQTPSANEEWKRSQKLTKDPRVTRLGRFLRKYSLDELPQLWNVLIGNMSLVGPRPMLPEQISMYPGTAYFSMRPGLTGLWQISERNESPFSSRALYDARYAAEMSLFTDISIILRTVGVVFRGTGL
jgi:lipopolysaccharide/colanic/teichoic acid biosynthesis glycosyltransferase